MLSSLVGFYSPISVVEAAPIQNIGKCPTSKASRIFFTDPEPTFECLPVAVQRNEVELQIRNRHHHLPPPRSNAQPLRYLPLELPCSYFKGLLDTMPSSDEGHNMPAFPDSHSLSSFVRGRAELDWKMH